MSLAYGPAALAILSRDFPGRVQPRSDAFDFDAVRRVRRPGIATSRTDVVPVDLKCVRRWPYGMPYVNLREWRADLVVERAAYCWHTEDGALIGWSWAVDLVPCDGEYQDRECLLKRDQHAHPANDIRSIQELFDG